MRQARFDAAFASKRPHPLLGGPRIAADDLAAAMGEDRPAHALFPAPEELRPDRRMPDQRAPAPAHHGPDDGGAIADIEADAAQGLGPVAVLTAPDVARVDLSGQPAAPAASARAYWSRSRGMVFTGTNLPQLPAGRTYQVWVVTDQAPISAGFLRPDPQGGVSGTFATPPDIPQPTAVAVTLEPEGGVPAPTGDRYLVGTVS